MDICSTNILSDVASRSKWLTEANADRAPIYGQSTAATRRATHHHNTPQTILSNEILIMNKILNSIIHNKNVTYECRSDDGMGALHERLKIAEPPTSPGQCDTWLERRDAATTTTTTTGTHKSHPVNACHGICGERDFRCNSSDTIYKSPINSYNTSDNNNSDGVFGAHNSDDVTNGRRNNKPNDNTMYANVTQQYNKLDVLRARCGRCHGQWQQQHSTDPSSVRSATNVCDSFGCIAADRTTMCRPCRVPDDTVALDSTAAPAAPSPPPLTKHSKLIVDPWWKHLVIIICYLFLFTSPLRICNANKHEVSNCTFPQRWEGSWFLSGNQQPIYIKGNTLSFRGKCMASDGDKFLVVDDKGCHRCLVIYEKHKNVLQYKESECEGDNMFMDQSNPAAMSMQQMRSIKSDHKGGAHPNIRLLSSSDQYSSRSNDDDDNYYCKGRETLQNLCEQIAGDALLYSLFKEDAEPVKCPLEGPFTFTYNRGHGECKSPVSNIESCTEESRLLLNLQACPDVAGTESTIEELTCLATWKDGNSRYLVGLVSHHHAVSNEERYRCFVYERILSMDESTKDAEFKLAQSGDATCNGLDSAEVGSRIMTLRRTPPAERCDFPDWFKMPKRWHSLAGNNQYVYHQSDGSMHVLKANGHMKTRALCEQINKNIANAETQIIVHQTTGCQSGFMCMIFYRRNAHIAEIQMGVAAARLEDACTADNFDVNKMPYITLVAATADAQECPLTGLYGLRGAIGPPFISTRHKRNHNKGHHHHHDAQYKRYTALSFRNSEELANSNWNMRSRLAPLRNRRDASGRHSGSIVTASTVDDTAVSPTQQLSDGGGDSTSTDPDNGAQRTRRDTPGCVVNYDSNRQLLVGCAQTNVIEVKPHCNDDGDEVYNCQGSWTENSTTFIVAMHSASQHGVCISYHPIDANKVRLYVGDSCYRSMHPQSYDHHLAANLTVIGKCTDVSAATFPAINTNLLSLLSILTTTTLILSR